MKSEQLIRIINEYGLKSATRRNLSLFNLSCVAKAYHIYLKDELGFSYKAIAALGKGGTYYTLLNEEEIAKETKKVLENKPIIIKKALERVFKKFLIHKKKS